MGGLGGDDIKLLGLPYAADLFLPNITKEGRPPQAVPKSLERGPLTQGIRTARSRARRGADAGLEPILAIALPGIHVDVVRY